MAIFLHMCLNGLLKPSSQEQQLSFRSSLLHGVLFEAFPYHVYCARGLSKVLHLCDGTELKQVAVHCGNKAT